MVMKRKTISKLAGAVEALQKATKASVEEEIEEDVDMQMVAVEETKEFNEKELVAARTKELKAVGAGDMKQLLENLGLQKGTKEDMIKTLLKHEAKERLVAREQKAKIRAVVINKKQELEGQSPSELSKLCENLGVKGLKSKQEKVQRLLVQWQENDGVDKALNQIAQDERQQELQALDSTKLQKLCTKIGVDPFVKEIMVERISKRENEIGCYSRPNLMHDRDEAKGEKNIDMIDSLLANESQRKKEKELKSQKEEALAKRCKDLKAMSLDDLKKRLAKKGLEASGKKDDMVQTLFIAMVQEDAAAERQTELKSKSQQELRDLLLRHGLEAGSKETMIKTLLAHEAKLRKDLEAFEAKVGETAEQKKKELETKTNAALKELCASNGLALGGDKDDKIERIVDELQKERNLDHEVSMNLRNKRREELTSMDKPAVVKLCEQAGVDPFVKDIMVERILSCESEGGAVIAMADSEPAAKKSRVKK